MDSVAYIHWKQKIANVNQEYHDTYSYDINNTVDHLTFVENNNCRAFNFRQKYERTDIHTLENERLFMKPIASLPSNYW